MRLTFSRRATRVSISKTYHYFGVKWEIVWDVVKNEIPDIKLKVEMMLRDFEMPD
jgi:uncharacterized protein with HEPN domain